MISFFHQVIAELQLGEGKGAGMASGAGFKSFYPFTLPVRLGDAQHV